MHATGHRQHRSGAVARWGAAVAGVLLAAACTTAPAPAPPSTPNIHRALAESKLDIAYGPDPAQRLDAYLPKGQRNAPVIFLIHGGGWMSGDKREHIDPKIEFWTRRGYVVVSANYRLVPRVRPLDQAGDVAQALALAQRQAPRWGADPARFLVIGHSAGAHLTSLLAAAPAITAEFGARPWAAAVALDNVVFDVDATMRAPHLWLYDRVFGSDPAQWVPVSPTLRLRGNALPLALACTPQREGSCADAAAFTEAAAHFGHRFAVVSIDISHAGMYEQLGVEGPYTSQIDALLRRQIPDLRIAEGPAVAGLSALGPHLRIRQGK